MDHHVHHPETTDKEDLTANEDKVSDSDTSSILNNYLSEDFKIGNKYTNKN